MKGLISLKCERPFLFDAIAAAARSRGTVTDWTAIITPRNVAAGLRADFYTETLQFRQFLELGGEPSAEEVGRLEQTYGDPTLWNAAVADRRIFTMHPHSYASNPAYRGYSHEEVIRLVARAFLAAERLLQRVRPDVIFLEAGSAVDEYALYRVASVMKTPTVFITETRLRNRWYLCPDPLGVSPDISREAVALGSGTAAPGTPDEIAVAADVLRSIREVAERSKSYAAAMDYVADLRSVKLGRLTRFPLRAAQSVLRFLDSGAEDDPYVPNPVRAIPDRLALRWRVFRDQRIMRWEEPRPGDRYAFFPLQMQPEATTQVMAPAFLDQVSLAETIARSLPISWKLYVKEHPMMLGCRPSAYYNRLRAIPNVRLIVPGLSSHALIKQAELVLTITGTASWEAAVIGTPAITFAPTPFDGCRGVARFDRGVSELGRFVKDVIAGRGPASCYEPADYVIAALRHSFPADAIAYARDAAGLAGAEIDMIVAALERVLATPCRPDVARGGAQ